MRIAILGSIQSRPCQKDDIHRKLKESGGVTCVEIWGKQKRKLEPCPLGKCPERCPDMFEECQKVGGTEWSALGG